MYNPFATFFVRTPYFPFIFLEEKSLEKKRLNQQVQEAIYIASPVLYVELQKYLSGAITNPDEKQKIESSLYRYISRMSSRCTPFGLFAGCSIGEIGDKTHVLPDNFKRHTRLDMYFLCTLAQELSKLPDVKKGLRYYPNTTLYPTGNKYRYIEYQYKNSRRMHRIMSVARSAYLDTMLKKAKRGIKIEELTTYLVDNNIPEENASDFIQELIDSQILVSELNPSVTGKDFFARIICVLENTNTGNHIITTLREIQKKLTCLDTNQENNIDLYQDIFRHIKTLNIPCEEKMLFQVDMTRNATVATLGKNIVDELQSTMTFLNRITPMGRNETLAQFQQAFYNRYEDREVLLMEALDTENGIGYPANSNSGDITPLLDNFFVPGRPVHTANLQTDAFHSILLKKTMDALALSKDEIVFNDDDIKHFPAYWGDFPATMYSMFEIIKSESDNILIYQRGLSGTCGANLMARFAHTNNEIAQFVSEITAKEQMLMSNVVLAEIAHLPDSRVGNILSRPHLRDYEILYLANSDLPESQLIYMSDLYISIRQGRIFLRSKKLNKEIIPRLTNAHNFHFNSMPVYRFLCDMQMQSGRVSLFFNWGYLENELTFLPRVRYKNTILSLATWKVKIEDMKHLFSIKDDDKLIVEAKKWREKTGLSQKILLSDGDNELFVDWENTLSIRSLFSIIKKRQQIVFKEFLFEPENGAVMDKNGDSYTNECIVAFYKNNDK